MLEIRKYLYITRHTRMGIDFRFLNHFDLLCSLWRNWSLPEVESRRTWRHYALYLVLPVGLIFGDSGFYVYAQPLRFGSFDDGSRRFLYLGILFIYWDRKGTGRKELSEHRLLWIFTWVTGVKPGEYRDDGGRAWTWWPLRKEAA